MKLYDELVKKVNGLLQGRSGRVLYTDSGKSVDSMKSKDLMSHQHGYRSDYDEHGSLWEDVGTHNMILRSDMAYELGGGTHAAVSAMLFTSDAALLDGDEILLYGPDLSEINQDISYARITIIQVDDLVDSEKAQSDKKAYDLYKQMEYTRFHVHPKGYMSRISTVNNREPVRIGKQALADGLSFQHVGRLMVEEYRKVPQVKAVKLIYITDSTFPYDQLEYISVKADQITESMNAIFHNLVMDCSVCGLKPVCDEVEGMKELHFSQMSADKNPDQR